MVRFTTYDDEIREQKLPCKILYMRVGVEGEWGGGVLMSNTYGITVN